jgi:metallo-beta-lactamase family protein
MKLTFNGAARIVTGSCYLLEAAGKKVLIDCGMFQGTKDITRRNYEPFSFNPREISHLLLTHAHIDHSGLIPKLVKNGFRGRIIATPPTIDLVKIMLEDSAHLNEDETEHENRRRLRMGLPPREPAYTLRDVRACFGLFQPLPYDKEAEVTNGIRMRFRNAGHILGSGIIELWAREGGKETKIVFSGDLGQYDTPLVDNPTTVPDADYVLVESTYGNRLHGDALTRGDLLSDAVADTFGRGGKLMIPSFAVERTQELLYYLHQLVRDREFPKEKIFLDSPLAIKATKVFSRNMRYFSPKLRDEFAEPFEFRGLDFLSSTRDSMSLNDYRAPCVIIAGNGMCSGGRIRHHLKHNLWKKQNTLLFVGYQAEGSLGRVILEGADMVRMMGLQIAVKAQIRQIDSFSSHADSKELLRWMGGFEKKPKKAFVVHGEEQSSMGLADALGRQGFETHVPVLGETVEL